MTNIERLQALTSTFAYLDHLQGVTGKAIHGPNLNRLYTVASDWVPFKKDMSGQEPWDFLIRVECPETLVKGFSGYELIESMDDYKKFRAVGDLFIRHYGEGHEFLDFETAWDIELSDEQIAELLAWLPMAYCMVKRNMFPVTNPGSMPEWLWLALLRLGENKPKYR